MRDPVRLDVVGVAVAAELVVGHDHLRAHLADDGDQLGGGHQQVGAPEAVGAVVGRACPPCRSRGTARAAEQPVVGDAELRHRRGQLAAPVLAEGVRPGRRRGATSSGSRISPFSPSGAGHEGDLRALGDVLGHGRARADALVVGVGVDEQQAVISGFHSSRG